MKRPQRSDFFSTTVEDSTKKFSENIFSTTVEEYLLHIIAADRSENILRFVWGTGNLKSIEQPRINFKGQVQINQETGRQSVVHSSVASYYGKQAVSALAITLFIMFTIFSAIMAQNVGMTTHAPGEKPRYFAMEYKVAGAALNLAIIGIYGLIFEAMATATTEWENHRTQSEVDNILVAKNFLFQFVNNYFVLFYIAYMREMKDPFSGQSHPCDGGNCLPELQTQLLVVFTTKTFGKQVWLPVITGSLFGSPGN